MTDVDDMWDDEEDNENVRQTAKLPPPMSAREWAVVARNRKTEIEALRAENARLRDLIDEASKIYVSLTNDSDDKIKQIVTSIKRLKDS